MWTGTRPETCTTTVSWVVRRAKYDWRRREQSDICNTCMESSHIIAWAEAFVQGNLALQFALYHRLNMVPTECGKAPPPRSCFQAMTHNPEEPPSRQTAHGAVHRGTPRLRMPQPEEQPQQGLQPPHGPGIVCKSRCPRPGGIQAVPAKRESAPARYM